MAYFKLQLLTPIYNANVSKKYVAKFLASTISEFYSQTESVKNNANFDSGFVSSEWEQAAIKNQKHTFCFTFDEKLEIHSNASKSLSFSMLRKVLINNEYIENPFFASIHNGSLLLLTDKYDNEYLFTVKNIDVSLTEINIQYNITCEDSFSYQLTRQNDGYTLENDSESEDFIGARNIDSWIVNYIIPDCHISYRYLSLAEGLYLDTKGITHIYTNDNSINDCKKILKIPYPKADYEDYYNAFVFSADNSNALNALITLAEKIDFNIKTCEHHNSNENEYDLYFWVEPTKKEEVSGLRYSPNTDIQDFSFSHNGESLTTVLNVQSNEISDDEIVSLFPNITPFFTQLFQDDILWNKDIQYSTGMFSSLCQHMQMSCVNGKSENVIANHYSVQVSDTIINTVSAEMPSYLIPQMTAFAVQADGIYLPLFHNDGSKFTIPFLYTYVDFYFNNQFTFFDITTTTNYSYTSKNKRLLLKVFYFNTSMGNYETINFGYNDIPSDLLKDNSLYFCYLYIPFADAGTNIAVGNIKLYLDFKRDAKDDLEFAAIADQCPWLENRIIDLNYFQKNKLISKYDYQQLIQLLTDDLRIINGKLMIYSNEYYNSLHKKTQLLAQVVNNLDSLGAAFNADVVDTYARTGSVTDIDRFIAAYNNVFVNINNQKQGWLSRDEDLTNYGNKYFNAQQRFLKNIYNFRKYWNTPTSFGVDKQVYTDTLSIDSSSASFIKDGSLNTYGFIKTEWVAAPKYEAFSEYIDTNDNCLTSLYKDTDNKTEISNIVSKSNYTQFFINNTDQLTYIDSSENTSYDKNTVYYIAYFDDLLNSDLYTLTNVDEAILKEWLNKQTIIELICNQESNSLWRVNSYTEDGVTKYKFKLISNIVDNSWKQWTDLGGSSLTFKYTKEEITYTLQVKNLKAIKKEIISKDELSKLYLLNYYKSHSQSFSTLLDDYEYHVDIPYKKTADNFWWLGLISYDNQYTFIDKDAYFFYFNNVGNQWFANLANNINTPVASEIQNATIVKLSSNDISAKNYANANGLAYTVFVDVGAYKYLKDSFDVPVLQSLLAFDLYRDAFPLNTIYYKGYNVYKKDEKYYLINGTKNTCDTIENFNDIDYLTYLPVTCTNVSNEPSHYRLVKYKNDYKLTYTNIALSDKYSAKTAGETEAFWDGTSFNNSNIIAIPYSVPYDIYNDDNVDENINITIDKNNININGYADLVYKNAKGTNLINNSYKNPYFIYFKSDSMISDYETRSNITINAYTDVSEDKQSYKIINLHGTNYSSYYSLFSNVCPTYSNLIFHSYSGDKELGYYYKDSYLQLLTKEDWINNNEKYKMLFINWNYDFQQSSWNRADTFSTLSKIFAADYSTIEWSGGEQAPALKNHKWQIINGLISKITHYDILNNFTTNQPFSSDIPIKLKDAYFSIEDDTIVDATKDKIIKYKVYSATTLTDDVVLQYFITPYCSYWEKAVEKDPNKYNTEWVNMLHYPTYDDYGNLEDWNEIYKQEMSSNLAEFKKYLFYILVDGKMKFFLLAKDKDYEINNNITPTKYNTNLFYWDDKFNLKNWYNKKTGTIADFSINNDFVLGYYYVGNYIENYELATEYDVNGVYYVDNNGWKERAYTLKELLNDLPYGKLCYLEGSTYKNTTLSNTISSWTLPIVHTIYKVNTLYKNVIKLKIDTINNNNQIISLDSIWIDDRENKKWRLASLNNDVALIIAKESYNTSYIAEDTINLTSEDKKSTINGTVITTDLTGNNTGEILKTEEFNLTINVDAAEKNLGITKYYDLSTWEELTTPSDNCFIIHVKGIPQGEVLGKMTNGQFWLKYHTYDDSDENLVVLFEQAAMIETELQTYWGTAYTASQYCEYFIPESWQDYLDTTYNYFQKSIYSDAGNLLTKYIPIIEIYNPNGQYKNGEMQKYILRYDSTDQTVKSIDKSTPLTYNANRYVTVSAASDVLGDNEVFLNQLSILNSSVYNWTAEKVDGATTTYYRAIQGGTTWKELINDMGINGNGYDYFNGLYIMTFRVINEQYFNRTSTLYNSYLEMHDNLWQEIYTKFPGVILEENYSNEDATTSAELMESASYYFRDLSEPERQYNLTLIDINNLKGYHGEELTIGKPIAINAEDYYDSYDEIKTTLNQYLFITDINYTLRSDSDIGLTVNSIKYQDKLIKRLVKLIK